MLAACPYPSGQGTQALVGELARGLSARGHRVHLICYAHSASARHEPFAIHRTPAVPGYRRLRSGPDWVKPWLDAALTLRAIQVVRNEGCELIHAHNYEGALAGFLAARATSRPLVYHAHNLMQDELPRYFSSPLAGTAMGLLGAGLDRVVPRLAGKVIALHAPLEEALAGLGVARIQLQVIEPGIDVDFWAQGLGPSQTRDPLQVAYCGNLDAYQNLALLLTAMARVVVRVPGAKLVLATGSDRDEAERLVGRAGLSGHCRVVVCPDAEATRTVLQRSALAVCPRSSPSGFPIKNLNAAAAGCPLVSCRSSAHGLIPGLTGLVVQDDDPEDLARAIVQLLQDPHRGSMLGEAGRVLAREKYSAERMAARVEKLWMEVLEARP